MPADIINFGHNWNAKLFGKAFSTIRIKNENKYQVGNEYEIQLHGKEIGRGVIRHINHFTIDQLSTPMALIDTGYSLAETKKIILTMYKNRNYNWSTQQLSFIVIEMPAKAKIPGPEYLYEKCYLDDATPEAKKA